MQQQQASQTQPHSRYKTSLCRHWQQTQTCSRGDNCHFAHGEKEMREASQNQPQQKSHAPQSLQFLQNNWNSGQPHNYKSVLCKKHEIGECKYGDNCNYAHGKNELRKPESTVTNQQHMYIIQQQIQQQMYQFQLMNVQNLMGLAQQLNKYIEELSTFSQISTIQHSVQKAKQSLVNGNLLDCQTVLNNAIFNEKHKLNETEQEQFTKLQDQVTQDQQENQSQGLMLPMVGQNFKDNNKQYYPQQYQKYN